MPQSLTQLPKTADIKIVGGGGHEWEIKIHNHRIINCANGLWGVIIDIIRDSDSSMDTLYQFEKHGISWEMAVECFAHELEYNDNTALSHTIYWCHDILKFEEMITEKTLERIDGFSASPTGRSIAEMYVDTVRNCDNWEQLYLQMHPTSRFQKEMESMVVREIKRVMPQSMRFLPIEAEINIGKWVITIHNNRVLNYYGLWGRLINIIQDPDTRENMLEKFDRQGVSWEKASECCMQEMENNTAILAYTIEANPYIRKINKTADKITTEKINVFSASPAGRNVADRYIDTIRNCDNWEQLYRQMHPTSRFQKVMGCEILTEFKQCNVLCRLCKLLLFGWNKIPWR